MLFRVNLHDLLILCTFGAIWGAIWASFLGCMVWRLPRGLPLSKHSYCPSCGHKLSPLDLVPIFSWFILGGKCRYCDAKIPASHVIGEIAFAAISVLCLLQYGVTVVMLRNWLFLCCLFCIALADWDCVPIPDVFFVIGLVAWVGVAPFMGMTVQEVVVSFLKCVLLFAVLENHIFQLLIDLFDFGPFKSYGYHTRCSALLGLVALYLKPLPALFALGLACLFLFLLRSGVKSDTKSPFGSMATMMAVSSAIILLGF